MTVVQVCSSLVIIEWGILRNVLGLLWTAMTLSILYLNFEIRFAIFITILSMITIFLVASHIRRPNFRRSLYVFSHMGMSLAWWLLCIQLLPDLVLYIFTGIIACTGLMFHFQPWLDFRSLRNYRQLPLFSITIIKGPLKTFRLFHISLSGVSCASGSLVQFKLMLGNVQDPHNPTHQVAVHMFYFTDEANEYCFLVRIRLWSRRTTMVLSPYPFGNPTRILTSIASFFQFHDENYNHKVRLLLSNKFDPLSTEAIMEFFYGDFREIRSERGVGLSFTDPEDTSRALEIFRF